MNLILSTAFVFRLEVADLEKSRMTGMLSSCKVKLSAALDEIEELHLEVDRLLSIERNLERIQASNVRKDATSKANKEAMEKTLKASDELRKHFDVFRVEADKEKKSLQRRNELVNARLKQKDELLSTALEKITCLERQQMDCMAERENFIKEQKLSSAVYLPPKTNTSLVKVVKTVKDFKPIVLLDASHVPVELRSSLADLNDVLTALGDGGSFVEAPTVPTDQSLGPF